MLESDWSKGPWSRFKEPFKDISAHHYVWDLFGSYFKWTDYEKNDTSEKTGHLNNDLIITEFFAGIMVILEKEFYGYVR